MIGNKIKLCFVLGLSLWPIEPETKQTGWENDVTLKAISTVPDGSSIWKTNERHQINCWSLTHGDDDLEKWRNTTESVNIQFGS